MVKKKYQGTNTENMLNPLEALSDLVKSFSNSVSGKKDSVFGDLIAWIIVLVIVYVLWKYFTIESATDAYTDSEQPHRLKNITRPFQKYDPRVVPQNP